MARTALIFIPENLIPPQSGFHHRSLEILLALRELGVDLVIASSELHSNRQWSENSVSYIHANISNYMDIFKPDLIDCGWDKLRAGYLRLRKNQYPAIYSRMTPPNMRFWFRKVVDQYTPDIIWMNYLNWDGIIDHQGYSEITRVIDSIDLVSLNIKMWSEIGYLYQPTLIISPQEVNEQHLNENLFVGMNLSVEEWEFSIYDRYSTTVAINPYEEDIIRQHTKRTNVVYVPMVHKLSNLSSNYSGSVLFTTGANPFNIQGYYFMTEKVMPLILRDSPDFHLTVTGYCSFDHVTAARGVHLTGFIQDYESVFLNARFFICPIYGGTGHLVKVTEAMSYGLPVVILRQSVNRTPVRHNINGFIANNAEEFAAYSLQLWNDKQLCKRLGDAAQETIASEFSHSSLLASLSHIIK